MQSTSVEDTHARWQEPARRPGARQERPLELLALGGAVALGALGAVLAIVYKSWYAHELDQDTAVLVCGLLFFVYTGGVYIFSYAWNRRDVSRAVRMTVVIVVLSAVAVLIAAVALALLSKSKGGGRGGGSGSGGDGEIDLGAPLRVLGSYVEDGSVDLEAATASQPEAPQPDLFRITCWQCGQDYIPVPPRAACPDCGWNAVTSG